MMMAYLNDEVVLQDESVGLCKFIGEIKGKTGLFYGLDLRKGEGINNGCIKNRRYFRTKNSALTGRFTVKSKIVKSNKTKKSLQFTVGDTIECPNLSAQGVIRYVGVPAFDKTLKTVYYGLALNAPSGSHNGEIYSSFLDRKISYFQCEANCGVYIKSSEITTYYTGNGDEFGATSDLDGTNDDDYKNDSTPDTNSSNNTDMQVRAKVMEIARLKGEIQKIQKQHRVELETLSSEFTQYKHESESQRAQLQNEQQTLREENQALKQDSEQTAQLMEAQTKEIRASNERVQKLQVEYDEVRSEFEAYKQQQQSIASEQTAETVENTTAETVENTTAEDVKSDNDDRIAQYKTQLKELQAKYNKAQQKVHSLGKNTSDKKEPSKSTEFLEKELEAAKAHQSAAQQNSKHRISGMLTKFAAMDINSGVVILKQLLTQWDSKFISSQTRVEYLKNFCDILRVIAGNKIDANTSNDELDAIIAKVANIFKECKTSEEEALKTAASDLYDSDDEEDIVATLMKKS